MQSRHVTKKVHSKLQSEFRSVTRNSIQNVDNLTPILVRFLSLCCPKRRHSLRAYKKGFQCARVPLRSFGWTTVAEEWRKNGSGVFRLQFEAEVATLPHSLEPAKLSQTNSEASVAYFFFFFSIHHRYILKFASVLFSFSYFLSVGRGERGGKEEGIPALQRVATQEFYTHWLPLFLIHEETCHIHDSTRLFSYVCFAGLFVCLFFISKATARCCEAPGGKEVHESFIFVCCRHLLVYACIKKSLFKSINKDFQSTGIETR